MISDDDYTRDDLSRDLFMMVKAGLLDVSIREDGEWLYSVTKEAEAMTDEEKIEAIKKAEEEMDE